MALVAGADAERCECTNVRMLCSWRSCASSARLGVCMFQVVLMRTVVAAAVGADASSWVVLLVVVVVVVVVTVVVVW